MRSLRNLINAMDDGTSLTNMPISSTTDSDSSICALCGKASICGGQGLVRYDLPVGHQHFGKLFPCPNYPTDPERREKLRKLGNLDAFVDKTFDNFQVDLPMLLPLERESLRAALAVAISYASAPDGWLLLEGTYGCGKTHLAAAVGNMRLERGDAVIFITTPDLLDHLRSAYGPTSEVGYDELFDRLKNTPMLILDDLGVENPSAWAQEKLFQLLNYRYSSRRPTVITTNVDLEALDPRVRSRLLDDNVIRRIRITAPDYRTPVQRESDQISDLALYHEMTFDTFDTRTGASLEEQHNLEQALAVARSYAAAPQDWLVFFGGYASGKTHLAAAIANAVQDRGDGVVFVTVPELIDHLRRTFNPGSPVTFDRRFQMIRGAPLLILDDLGTESASAWAKEKLFQIINHRFVARLPTVITTAKAIDELDERLRSRLLDRRRCALFAITSPAYAVRLNRK
ncbi:MAG: ATP-binding protein [Aggregatilineales bacterium]